MEDKTRVQKFIALSGLCSRRNAEDLIKEGRVKVNGKVIEIGHTCLKTDKIEVDEKEIEFNEDFVYIVMNKSSGYVTTKSDEFGRKTVYDFLKPEDNFDNLFSIGRLDKDTSGLLILTNDGQFTQSVIHPSKKVEKKYIVQLDRELKFNDQRKLEGGVVLDNYRLKPLKVRKISKNKYVVIISEGRKRQIRRMFDLLDYNVENLHRIAIGNLDLKELEIGFKEYKFVEKEFLIEKIFS